MKKRNITLFTAIAAAAAFAPTANAEILVNGSAQSDPKATTGIYTMKVPGENKMDDGSVWTHDGGTSNTIFKLGNNGVPNALFTISGGSFLDIIGSTSDGDYTFQVGNKGLASVLITGDGSTVRSQGKTNIGRKNGASQDASGSTLTIEDGGRLISEVVTIGRGNGEADCKLRMGLGGILAIEGAGKTLTSQLWNKHATATGSEIQYWDGAGWANITGATGGGVDYTIADGTGDLAGYSVLTMAGGTTTPAADPEITSITSLGSGNFELTLKGEPSTSYEFYSSATLDFTSGGDLVPLTAGGTDVTTDGSGDATVQMSLAGSANFVRAQ